MVAIARAVDMECKVLILDEPTSSLDEQEVEKLFKLMLDLQDARRRHHLCHPLPRAGLRRLRPHHGAARRQAGRRIQDRRICRACSWCPRCWARSWTICPKSRAISAARHAGGRGTWSTSPQDFPARQACEPFDFSHPQGRGQRLYRSSRLRPKRVRARDLRRGSCLRRHRKDGRQAGEDHQAASTP